MLRPKPMVLSNAALVAPANTVTPPPNQFTHEVIRSQPFYYQAARGNPDGVLAAGTRVVLMVHGRPHCWVVTGQGLYVRIPCAALKKL